VTNVTRPKAPEGLRPLEMIQKDQAEADEQVTQIRLQEKSVEVLERQLKNAITLPDPMPDTSADALVDLLERAEKLEAEQKKARIEYPMIARMVDAGAGDLDVSMLKEDVEIVLNARSVRKPKFTRDEVESYTTKHEQNDAFIMVKKLREELETYQSCPRCGLSFEKEAAEVTEKINKHLAIARPHSGLPSREALEEALADNFELEKITEALTNVESKYAHFFSAPVDFSQQTYERYLCCQ
jgi:hypothetical protein